MAAQTVGAEAVLEFFDAVLAFSAIIVKREDFRGAALAVGDQETQIGSHRRMLGLVTDAPLAGPRAGTVGKAGEAALRELAAAIATLQFLLQSFGATLEHRIRGNANNVGNAKELAALIKQR